MSASHLFESFAMADTSAEEKELYNQSKAFFQKHMPEANDEVLVVLKGHLLLEQAIEKIIALRTVNPKEIYGFTFSQKVQILKAITPERQLSLLKPEALLIINKIRNQLAHKLDPQNIENLTRDLAKAVGVDDLAENTIAIRLYRSIAYLCGYLNAVEHVLMTSTREQILPV